MEWLKQNVVLAVSIAVAVAIIGGAGWFFYTKISSEQDINTQLAQVQQTLTDLQSKVPYPSQENLAKVLEQQKELLAFRAKAEQYFEPFTLPKWGNDNTHFNAVILSRIDDLQRQAQRASVTLPTNFAFGFSVQRDMLQFDSNTLPIVASQLVDVTTICEILFQAKVYEIARLRRTAVSAKDTEARDGLSAPADYLPASRPVVTNDVTKAVIFPYEATFKASTAELAAILEAMARSPKGLAVQYITAAPWDDETQETEATGEQTTPVVNPYRYRGMNPMMFRRYFPQASPPPPPTESTPTGTPRKPGNALKEKPLRISLFLHVIKLQPIKQ